MTNNLVGDVYQKIIEEVVSASTNDVEESGVGQATLNELRQAWQAKLSARKVAQMPWDPKPEPPQRMQNGHQVGPVSNGISQQPYSYSNDTTAVVPNGARIKMEPGVEQYSGAVQANVYAPNGPQQGGIARAQELVQERFGQQAAAAFQRPAGLALPGQQQKPQVLPQAQSTQQAQQQQQQQQQYSMQQQQMVQRQQQALQNQQNNPRIKLESDSQSVPQAQFQQRIANPAYAQTDGAGDYEEWQAYLAQCRAIKPEEIQKNDSLMRDRISALSHEFESGLMLPMRSEAYANQRRSKMQARPVQATSSTMTQLDGADEDDEDVKPVKKHDEDDDEDAINSDLDDPDEDANPIGDEDDDNGDTILCTYDKVQRVKNKWKCTLKDGVLNTGGKEWLFHKGQGEFEW